jgi:hypothetical protein
MSDSGWSRAFAEPIPLPGGRQLVTLRDAAQYITKLPKAEHDAPEWQAAIQALMLVVGQNGPTMLARIGFMRAVNRGYVREFNPDRKDHQWGRRKLKRDGNSLDLHRHKHAKTARLYRRRVSWLTAGMPMQVVVPSVSLAATLQRAGLTRFFETSSPTKLSSGRAAPTVGGELAFDGEVSIPGIPSGAC